MITQFTISRWYHDGKRAYEVLAIEGDRLLVRYQGEAEPVRRFISGQATLAEPLDGPPQPANPTPRPKAGKTKTPRNDTTFGTAETSPLIADLIRRRCRETGDFITHDEIVQLILNDPKGQRLIEEAVRLGNTKPPAGIAGNMLDHFSAHITTDTSEFIGQFERKKIGGKWAYRPR